MTLETHAFLISKRLVNQIVFNMTIVGYVISEPLHRDAREYGKNFLILVSDVVTKIGLI